MVGQTIFHYKVVEKIGQGGTGAVFLAQDATLESRRTCVARCVTSAITIG
jgi:hypothetical protein